MYSFLFLKLRFVHPIHAYDLVLGVPYIPHLIVGDIGHVAFAAMTDCVTVKAFAEILESHLLAVLVVFY